jgi:hypothetical protein
MSELMSPSGSCPLFQLFPYSYCSPCRAPRRAVPFELLLTFPSCSLRYLVRFDFPFPFCFCSPVHVFCSLISSVPFIFLFTSILCFLLHPVHSYNLFPFLPCSLTERACSLQFSVRSLALFPWNTCSLSQPVPCTLPLTQCVCSLFIPAH